MTKKNSLKARARAWSAASGKKYTAALADVVAGTAFTGQAPPLSTQHKHLPLGPALALLPSRAPWEGPSADPLKIPLGRGPIEELIWDLTLDPHILLAGGGGSGKSVAQRAILGHCLGHPDAWRVFGIDLKKVELTPYRSREEVVLGVATSLEDALTVLRFLRETMMKRFALMEDEGVHTIDALPSHHQRILLMVDEMGELISPTGLKTEDEKKRDVLKMEARSLLEELVRLGRAAGIHLVVATQRPDASIIPGTMKALLSARLLMGRSMPTLQMMVLDTHQTLEVDTVRGRGLFRATSTRHAVLPFQVYWASEEEVLAAAPKDPSSKV